MLGKKGAIGWLIILIALSALTIPRLITRWRPQTDILALLPNDERDPAVRTLRRMITGQMGRSTLFLVSHTQPELARDATRQLGRLLTSSSLFSAVQWNYRHQQQAFFDLYFPLRYRMISPNLRHYLERDDGGKALIQRLTHELYQPTSSFITRFLEDDPLLFFPDLMKSWQPPTTQLHITDGLLGTHNNGQYHYLITTQLAANPFEVTTQVQLEASWRAWTEELYRSIPGLRMTYTSMARFAAATRQQMQNDLLWVSFVSISGITLLLFITFRSIKYFLAALLSLAVGLWSGLGISLLVFDQLHALTLVFGASLIGICIDYSLHYFAHHRVALNWHPNCTMRRIVVALALGCLTTLLSYAGLGLTPLVGLQQIATFAACGLLASFSTVVLWFPLFFKHAHPQASAPPLLYEGSRRFLELWIRLKIPLFVILALVIVLCVKGFFSLQINDNPQLLTTLPTDAAEQDQFIRNLIGAPLIQQFLIVEKPTAELALQTLEQFQANMSTSATSHSADFGPLITNFLPSLKRQHDDVTAVQRLLDHRKALSEALTDLGFTDPTIRKFFDRLANEPGAFLQPAAWLRHEASIGLRHLWLGETPRGAAILVPLLRVHDIHALQETVDSFTGIRYFDQVEDMTQILARYRRQALRLVGVAYLMITTLLVWRYRMKGFAMMLPPCLAVFMTTGILGLAGIPFNLMHCLTLLLILGMGIDYTIFLMESQTDTQATTLLALTLSTLTTLLSFGLLSLSSQAVLRSIGFTALIGIFCTWILAPLITHWQTS